MLIENIRDDLKGLFAGADCKTPRSLPASQSRWFTISLGSSKLRKVGRSHNTQPIFTIFKEHFLQARAKLFFSPLVSMIVAPSGEIHVPGLSSMRINILSINQ